MNETYPHVDNEEVFVPRGLSVLDVEGTFYDPTDPILKSPFKGDLAFSSSLIHGVLSYALKKWVF